MKLAADTTVTTTPTQSHERDARPCRPITHICSCPGGSRIADLSTLKPQPSRHGPAILLFVAPNCAETPWSHRCVL